MKNYGDVTKINGAEVPKVNVITFGAPCQDLSLAGKRAGMKSALMGDEETTRSGLFFEAIRIIKEMREDDKRNGRTDVNIRPRFAVYENVPGAFSSNHGEDFRAVLEETAKVADKDAVIPGPTKGKWTPAGCIMGDGWSIAWRVHDAQFWGVPQRRKRISLVADFGGSTAPEILFERKSVSGDIETSGKEREGAAADVRSGIEETGGCLNGWDVQSKHIQPENGIAESLYAGECRGGGESYVMQSISFQERAGKPGGGKGILIQNERTGALSTLNNQSVVYGISAYDSNAMKSGNPNSGIYEAETARTLDLNGGSPACNQGGMAVVSMATKQLSQNIGDNVAMPICANDYKEPQVVCVEGNGSRPSHRGDGYSESETMYTLNTIEKHAVCVENHPQDSRVKIKDDGICQTLDARMGMGGGNVPMVMESSSWDGGQVSPTLTANNANGGQRMPDKDNFNAVLSYGLDRAAYNQGINAQYDFAVDEEKIGTQVAKGPGAVCENGGIYARTQNQVLRLLSETYGAQEVEKWGIAILATLQSSEILQSGMYESGVSSKTENRYKLDDSSLPCSSVVAGWLLRDMWKQQECRRASQGWESTEQQSEQFAKTVPELSQQNPQTCKEMFDMWQKGEGIGLLQQALYQIQKIRQSVDVPGAIVRRLTPLEAERLQGFPDHWTDIGDWVDSKGKKHKGDSDSPRYKALGNSIALPFWKWMAKRMRKYLGENPTMASLFSGIGGFELSFYCAGVEPVWASEIEEFPIAVTKIRFPD